MELNTEKDSIFLEWGVFTPLYQFNLFIKGVIRFAFKSVIFMLILVAISLTYHKLYFLLMFVFFYLFVLVSYFVAIFIIITLSLISALFYDKKLDKVFLTSKGIFFLQAGGLGGVKTFFQVGSNIASRNLLFKILVSEKADDVIDKLTENIRYNYSAWKDIKKVIVNRKDGMVSVIDKSRFSVGAIYVPEEHFQKTVKIFQENIKNGEIVLQ
jgi:hypothetical protein